MISNLLCSLFFPENCIEMKKIIRPKVVGRGKYEITLLFYHAVEWGMANAAARSTTALRC